MQAGPTHLKFDSYRQNCGCDMHPVSAMQSALRHGFCGPSSPYPFTYSYTTASSPSRDRVRSRDWPELALFQIAIGIGIVHTGTLLRPGDACQARVLRCAKPAGTPACLSPATNSEDGPDPLPPSPLPLLLPPSSFLLPPSSFLLSPFSFLLFPSSFLLSPSSLLLFPSSFLLSPSSLLPPSSWSARPPATSHQSIAYQKKGFPRVGGNPYASPHIASILRKHVLSCCNLTSPVRQNGARGYVSSLYLFSCFGGHVPMFFLSAKSESLPDVRTGSRWQRGFQCLAVSRPACCPVASLVRQAPHRLCGPIARSVDFHTPTAIIKTQVRRPAWTTELRKDKTLNRLLSPS